MKEPLEAAVRELEKRVQKLEGSAAQQCSKVEEAKIMLSGLGGRRHYLGQGIDGADRLALTLVVAIWALFLRNGIPASGSAMGWAGGLSSVVIGLWRLYARSLDNGIAKLYPSIWYYEREVGVAVENSLVLKSRKDWPSVEALRKGVEDRIIGTRGHLSFDVVALVLVLLMAGVTLYNGGWRQLTCCGCGIPVYQYVLSILYLVGVLLIILAMNIFQTDSGGIASVNIVYSRCDKWLRKLAFSLIKKR